MKPLFVNKPYLPNREQYKAYIDQLFESCWLTNKGELVQTLEERLRQYLGVKHLILVANGSLALQLAYHALDLRGEVITTPFSFAATTNTLVWESLKPIFADIDSQTFNLDPSNIETQITEATSAIVPVHVYGNPCKVELIQDIAKQYHLNVVYDAAHAFGVHYKGQSVLNYGDISTLSFHATKLFHTIEGGAVITNDDALADKVRRLLNFGFAGPYTLQYPGINAKMNEFEAAMGLCVLDDIDFIRPARESVWAIYQQALAGYVAFQQFNQHANNNGAYAPIVLASENQLLGVQKHLSERGIITKRYFYPSLDTLAYLDNQQIMPISRDIAQRTLCLPISDDLTQEQAYHVAALIKEAL